MTTLHQKFVNNLPVKIRNSYSREEIVQAMINNYNHPTLTERLVNLRKNKVDIRLPNENPWFAEMISFGITEKDIAIISEFLNFKKSEKAKELKKYKSSGRGSFVMTKCCSVALPASYKYFRLSAI